MQEMHKPSFFIYRNKNKQIIRNIMNNLDWQPNDEAKDLSKSDSLSAQQLQAMHLVAKMRDAANNCGAGFVGGFISPTGERFMMSNMNEDDPQYAAIQQQLDSIQRQRVVAQTQAEAQERMNNSQRNIERILREFEGMFGDLRDPEEADSEE